jgi:hypothetical protein
MTLPLQPSIIVYDQAQEEFGNWTFDAPTLTKNGGGRTVYIHNHSSSPQKKTSGSHHPRIQLCKDDDPRLICPFGLGNFQDSKSCPSSTGGRMTLDMSVTHTPLIEFFKALDSLIINVACRECNEWFSKNLTRQQITSMYRPCLTQKSDNYPAAIRTKLTLKGGEGGGGRPVSIWKVIEESSGNIKYTPGSAKDITRGSEIWACVDVTSMYFMSTLFGCTLTVSDLLVYPPRQSFPFLTTMKSVMMIEQQHDRRDDEFDDDILN